MVALVPNLVTAGYKKTAACKAPEIYDEVVLGRKGLRTHPLAYVVIRSGSGSRSHDLRIMNPTL